jgi:subtilisin family serine protease
MAGVPSLGIGGRILKPSQEHKYGYHHTVSTFEFRCAARVGPGARFHERGFDPAGFDHPDHRRPHPGYPTLPLILVTQGGGGVLQGLPAPSVRTTRYLPSIGGQAVLESAASAGAFWGWLTGGGGGARTSADPGRALRAARSTGVTKVWLDGRARLFLDESGPQIGLPAARAAGLDGSGVTVAVLDTGIKADHPDLAGRVVEVRDFTETSPEATDDVGHGTHVAGIVAGSGVASGGRYQGVAPAVRLLNGKAGGRELRPGHPGGPPNGHERLE